MPRVLWEPDAVKELRELEQRDRKTAARVAAAIEAFARTGTGDLNALKGRSGELRLRVGDWRVILEHQRELGDIVTVNRIRLRRDAYDD